jgi:YegS/Rv2252/BmrU family lipid kinase
MKKIRFILNPVAGKGKAPLLKSLIERHDSNPDFEFEIILTKFAGHGSVLAAEAAAQHYYAVVAAGGDGTVNEIARVLAGTPTALGIIPMGSGNGFSRHLGYSMDPETVIRQILAAGTTEIDTLLINNMLSVNVSGFGFDGYVAWLYNQSGKRGLKTYTQMAMKAYAGYQPAVIRFNSPGGIFLQKAHMLVIANASQFGNKATIAPRAKLDDGLMDVVFVHKPPVLSIPSLFLRLFSGNLRDTSYIKTVQCTEFQAVADRPLHIHIDGESVEPVDTISVKLIPRNLRILRVSRQ